MKTTHQVEVGKYKSLAKVATKAEPIKTGPVTRWAQACIPVGTAAVDAPDPVATGLISADGREWIHGWVLLQTYAGSPAEMTTLEHSFEIPGGLSQSFDGSSDATLDGVQAWAESVLTVANISTDWRVALGATDANPATAQWYAANALASVVSTREFIADGKARDAVSTAMWASAYYHSAMMQELSERVHIGAKAKQTGKHGYTDTDREEWRRINLELKANETYSKSRRKRAAFVSNKTGAGFDTVHKLFKWEKI